MNDLDTPAAPADTDPTPRADLGPPAPRARSPRGFVAALTALLIGGVAGTAVFVAVAARIDRAPRWSRELLERAHTHDWRTGWVLAAGIVAAVLGLWLIVLAVTPGRRHLLQLRPVHPDMSAWMTRRTAASLLRHTALAAQGVVDARVRAGRRKAVVRVDYHFRDADELADELDAALRARAADLMLARVPRIHLRLQPLTRRR